MNDLYIFFIITQIFSVMYWTKQLSLFSLVNVFTFIYNITYIYPYTYKLYDNNILFYEGLTRYNFFDNAITTAILFKIIFDVSYFITKGKENNKYELNDKYKYYLNMIKYKYLIILFILNSFVLLYSIGLDNLINPSGRFVGNYPKFINLTKAIYILELTIVTMKVYSSKNKSGYILLIIIFIFSLIYPMLISSRSVVFPFIVVSAISIIFKHYKNAFISLFFSLVFLITALHDRADVGVYNFILKLNNGFENLFTILEILVNSMNSFMIFTLSLSGLSTGAININPNPLLFVLYLSPLPSVFLPSYTYKYQSLNAFYNLGTGINADLLSELTFWFGPIFMYFFALFLAYLIKKIDTELFLAKNKGINILYSFYYFGFIIFIIMMTVASIRASSRLIIYVFIIHMLILILRKNKNGK